MKKIFLAVVLIVFTIACYAGDWNVALTVPEAKQELLIEFILDNHPMPDDWEGTNKEWVAEVFVKILKKEVQAWKADKNARIADGNTNVGEVIKHQQ